ncbi:MAG: acetyl-CoA carboxylase biotin carboxyl carrier protein subunit [Bacteroidia bacterium]|nr:acetyl-CoA carboxylase biotin carboxyl carrier protein subunit [Bacteroidales bacterium]NCD10710.1 acetyl-CoA carboxylase biotin carboxyl carrier protein subunit [Negativicutes bacterium]NCD42415.1 acetyl-CoA carboxylase biotin carboxyl carrier protein subunit [Bacteroidia bacterium]MDD2322379.1 acetyl-CoA carboxylase biotin carboxyl carrier protein subunit [Bacteroidales bacterium]MDD3010641.1 acetyl-CoA carboxylase biotin carboxyl carrier protein subunit [Bacteroidales bacterium]
MRYKSAPEGYKFLNVENGRYKTMLTTKFVSREKFIPNDPKKIYSVIPGTIREIYIKAGSKVKEGDTMMILEAMKMMNNILAPESGIIKSIHVEKGIVVPKSALLIEFE